jgi:hypothetical protein
MEVAHLLGDPKEVDLASLKWQGPVRVKVGCRDSREIKGETQVFFNGDSHKIKWVVESGKDQFDKAANKSRFDRHRDKADEDEDDEEESQDKYSPKQQQDKHDIGQTFDANRETVPQHKTKPFQIVCNTKADDKIIPGISQQIGEEDTNIHSGDNQVLTRQSATEGIVSQDKMEKEQAQLENNSDVKEVIQVQDAAMTPSRKEQQGEKSLTKESDQSLRSDELDEELLDYDEDYEPTEQEKVEWRCMRKR